MSIHRNSQSRRPLKQRSASYYVQPIWRIHGLVDAGTVTSDDGPGRFPSYIHVHTSIFKDVVEHRKLSLEGLAYYVYWIAGNQRLQQWSSDQQAELNLSAKQIARMRRELRACGLLTMIRAGTTTYSCIHHCPVPEAQRQDVANSYALAVKQIWGLTQKYRVTTNPDPMTPFYSIHVGATSGHVMVVFTSSIRTAATALQPGENGMNRLKALGLWMLLCNKPGWFNWSSGRAIAEELGFSQTTIAKHLKELIALKLVYYDQKQQVIGVSRFPENVHENLHPMSCELKNIPWKSFHRAQQSL